MEDPIVGQQLGNYRIHRVLGRGGMATVYYGWDENLQRPVAIKLLDTRYRGNPAYAQRFVEEARAVSTWRHEHVLQVYFAGQEEGLYFFAMEYIDGPDLGFLMRQYADEGELMPHEDVLRIGRAVAAALDYAHRKKVVHRDVKPSNVMVAKDGRVVLADFGLALNLQRGSMGETFGTPHYIAPEQARNSAMAVPQSDFYSLGIILYELLTGSVPFDDPSPTSLALQHINTPPPPPRKLNPRLNEATAAVLLKALAKEPKERYQSGEALLDALASAVEEPVNTGAEAALPPLPSGVAGPSLSRQSVAERVSLYMPPLPAAARPFAPVTPAATDTPVSPPPIPPAAPPAPAPSPQRVSIPLRGVGVGVLAVVALIVLIGLLGRGDGDEAETAVSLPALTSTPTVTTAAATPTAQPAATASATLPPEATDVPQAAPTDTVETAAPTAVPATVTTAPTTVSPAATIVPATDTPIPPTLAPPTPVPTGRPITLLYDGTGFYLYNPGAARVRASSLRFEALNNGGNVAGPVFSGGLWAQFYSFVEQNRCVRIELNQADAYLRPSQCASYNATVTLRPDDDNIFWQQQANVAQFRVLWNDTEVGRCPAAAAEATTCEVYLP